MLIGQSFWRALLDSLKDKHYWTALLYNLIVQPYWTALLNSLIWQPYFILHMNLFQLKRITHNVGFSKNQNSCYMGNGCIYYLLWGFQILKLVKVNYFLAENRPLYWYGSEMVLCKVYQWKNSPSKLILHPLYSADVKLCTNQDIIVNKQVQGKR